MQINTETLAASAQLLWADMELKKQLTAFRADNFPYTGGDGLPLFIAFGTEISHPRARGGGGDSNAETAVTCPICAEEWLPSAMRQHIGFHMVHEKQLVTATYPCGFCGGECAPISSDLSQSTGCAVWLMKGPENVL